VTMAHVVFENVTLKYPIYNAGAMSLPGRLIQATIGGLLSRESRSVMSITALDNVSFTLNDGDFVGVIGPNGAGKTTLIRTIAGIYTPFSGSISRSGRISAIIELGAGLYAELSGYENIYRLAMLHGLKKSSIQSLIPEIEQFTELGDFLHAPVRTYSSGMLMRLMFAVKTATRPEILLVDETFGAGDKSFQEKAKARMESMISTVKILVLASHSEPLVQNYCNRIFEIQHGSLREVS